MNFKGKTLIKNFSFSLISNFASMLISSIVVLLVPKFIGASEYGYYQLYVLYIGYVGLLQFGIIDGIYLRYGGAHYEDLDKGKLCGQWLVLLTSQIVVFIAIFVYTLLINDDSRGFILLASGICMILTNLRGMLTYVFQTTNRIKEYAIASVIGRITFLVIVIIMLIGKVDSFVPVIIADLVGRLVALIYSIINAKEIVFSIKNVIWDLHETVQNYSVGIKLTFANIASSLVLGIVKFGIEQNWDIATFGKASLTISISSLLVQFINAIALVLFPTLKRNSGENQKAIYFVLKRFFIPLMYLALAFYYPFSLMMSQWLPEYCDGLRYMALLFPVCIYEGRQALINNTYLKAYRQEKKLLQINVISLVFSGVMTVIFSYCIKSLNLTMISILLVLMFRCLYADFVLSKIQKISVFKEDVEEVVLMALFIISAWMIKSFVSTIVYVVGLCLYVIVERKQMLAAITELKCLSSRG